jgi:membrane protease YdiL (CAAX protease family)
MAQTNADQTARRIAPPDYPGCPASVPLALAKGPLRAPRWGVWDCVIMIVGALVLSGGVIITLQAIQAPTLAVLFIGSVAPWVFLGGYPLVITAWRGNGPRIDLGLTLRWIDVGWAVIAGVVGLLIAGLLALATQAIFGEFTSAGAEVAEEIRQAGGTAGVLVFALLLVIGAPIVEELAFRGLVFNSLRKAGVGIAWTLVISSVAFAVIHFEPTRMLVLLALGLVLGIVRWRTRSLLAPMITHAMINAPAALVLTVGMAI